MKRIKYTLVLLCSLPFWLGSCETVVELDLPPHAPKLVLNAVINPDSLFTVDLSASQSAFSNEPYAPVDNATVGVFSGGNHLFDLRHKANGIYQAPIKPQARQQYEVRARAPGYPSVSATGYVPVAPTIHSVQTASPATISGWGPGVQVTFTLEDAAEQVDFYYIQVYTPDTSHFDNNKPYNRALSFTFMAPIEEEFTMEARNFFSDKLFNGQSLNLKLYLEYNPNKTFYVRVAHISEEYYQYVRMLEKQYNPDLFLTPQIPVSNNIRNGMGLFAGYNAITLTIKP